MSKLTDIVAEIILNKITNDNFVYFEDSDVSISWYSEDGEFCLEGFDVPNIVNGFWKFCSPDNLKHWLSKLSRMELEEFVDCPSKFIREYE